MLDREVVAMRKVVLAEIDAVYYQKSTRDMQIPINHVMSTIFDKRLHF